MNDEQVVLDFFSKEENLPLALIAGDHIDGLRLQHNNAFWKALHKKLSEFLTQQYLPWECLLTEDRNTEDCLVGLHLQPLAEQSLFLRPFMEQQFMGSSYRIYYGLMWSNTPEPDRLNLPEVTALRTTLEQDGFKQSDSFLSWSWTPWHPRRQDFLLRFSQQKEDLLEDAAGMITHFIVGNGKALQAANEALAQAPRNITIPLDQLRASLKR